MDARWGHDVIEVVFSHAVTSYDLFIRRNRMTRMIRDLAGAAGALAILAGPILHAPITAADEGTSRVEQGKQIAFSRKKGNCLACHIMGDGPYPGNIAPPLVAMQSRYPDKAKLRTQIWDPTAINPESAMPPFGKHMILSDQELDLLVEYVWTL